MRKTTSIPVLTSPLFFVGDFMSIVDHRTTAILYNSILL